MLTSARGCENALFWKKRKKKLNYKVIFEENYKKILKEDILKDQ